MCEIFCCVEGPVCTVNIAYPKCLAPEVSRISDFGILAYYNETAWGWEPNLNAKSIYVTCKAYVYIGFIYDIKTNSALNLFTNIYICTASCSCRRAKSFGFWRFFEFRIRDIQPVIYFASQCKNKFKGPKSASVLNWQCRQSDVRLYIQNMSDTIFVINQYFSSSRPKTMAPPCSRIDSDSL
jgi:hypothetical protein